MGRPLVLSTGAFATSDIVFVERAGAGTAVAVPVHATIVRAMPVSALMVPGPLAERGLRESEAAPG